MCTFRVYCLWRVKYCFSYIIHNCKYLHIYAYMKERDIFHVNLHYIRICNICKELPTASVISTCIKTCYKKYAIKLAGTAISFPARHHVWISATVRARMFPPRTGAAEEPHAASGEFVYTVAISTSGGAWGAKGNNLIAGNRCACGCQELIVSAYLIHVRVRKCALTCKMSAS